jgi:hypothetical protein
MATKTVRRIATAGIAGSAALVLAAAPASASGSSIVGSGSDRAAAASGAVTNGTQAGSARYVWSTTTFQCYTNHEVVGVRMQENGVSGVTHFKATFVGQVSSPSGWRNVVTGVRKSKTFPNNATSFYYSPTETYSYPQTGNRRVVWTGLWLGAGNRVIARASHNYVCVR